MMRRSLIIAVALAFPSLAYAWPDISHNSAQIHIELPAVHIVSTDSLSAGTSHLRTISLHFAPINVLIPAGISKIHAPLALIENALNPSLSQFLPAAVCGLAVLATDRAPGTMGATACEATVAKTLRRAADASTAAARFDAAQIDCAGRQAGKATTTVGIQGDIPPAVIQTQQLIPLSGEDLSEAVVESVCDASSAAICEVVGPRACERTPGQGSTPSAPSHSASSGARQAACQAEVVAGCATLVQSVCEAMGQAAAANASNGTPGVRVSATSNAAADLRCPARATKTQVCTPSGYCFLSSHGAEHD